jgi:hypothetical protein
MSGGKILDKIIIVLRDIDSGHHNPVVIDVYDNSLAHKWLNALNILLRDNYHLEKNYCFLGFADHNRHGEFLLDRINRSISEINCASLGYKIDDYFILSDVIVDDPAYGRACGRNIVQSRLNQLHRYFEDLQGTHGALSEFYHKAAADIRWHIRQLNLLCHEFESWALSYRKQIEAPDWQRPSQLMCWLQAPRFAIDKNDLQLFGIDTINRSLGGVFVGVNKAIGKHHWEVFNDEGRDSRIGELTSSTLRNQTQASGDFDIEWGRNPGEFIWQQKKLKDFREWLCANNFEPDDPALTIGHPQIGQVDLFQSFGTDDFRVIWKILNTHLDVWSVETSDFCAIYDYHWSDPDYPQKQIDIIGGIT